MLTKPAWDRRKFLFAGASSVLAANNDQPQVAITIDDFGWKKVPEPWRARASDTLLQTLRTHNLQAAGFVAGKRVDSPEGLGIVKQWRDAGHWIGNHTYSHEGIDSMGLAPFQSDVLRNQRLLGDWLTTPRYFRFPMLKEGATAAVRDRMRAFLKEHAYRNGAVTIDASDWYYSDRLSDRLARQPGFDWQRYREPYLKHITGRARYYDGLATALLGRKIRHTLLIHFNLINVLFLGGLLEQFRQMGWRLVDASAAFADPVFARSPNTVPAGESLLWALAKESGRFGNLRYPGEDDVYEKPILDALKL
jgi:peptidoglycan/xylan/chitin deacetylase (PgdA/CDA1 family)